MQRCSELRFIVAVTNWTRRRRCYESTWINIPPRVISRRSKTCSLRWKRNPTASKRGLKPATTLSANPVVAGFSPRSDILRFTRKRRRGFRWLPMMRRLLISIRQLQKSSLIVGTSHKSDTCGKVVRGESRGNRDGGNKHEEGIQVRNALC